MQRSVAYPPMFKVAYTIKNHCNGVRWFESQVSNVKLEGFNSLVQVAKARSYGTTKNFINMAYLVLGKLDLRISI